MTALRLQVKFKFGFRQIVLAGLELLLGPMVWLNVGSCWYSSESCIQNITMFCVNVWLLVCGFSLGCSLGWFDTSPLVGGIWVSLGASARTVGGDLVYFIWLVCLSYARGVGLVLLVGSPVDIYLCLCGLMPLS